MEKKEHLRYLAAFKGQRNQRDLLPMMLAGEEHRLGQILRRGKRHADGLGLEKGPHQGLILIADG